MKIKFSREWIVYILLFIAYVSLMPRTGHKFDLLCWREWAKHDLTHGLAHAYLPQGIPTDYLPLWHYFLYAFAWFQGSVERIDLNIHWIKMIPLFFEFIGGFIFIKLIRTRFSNPIDICFYSALLFLNIGYFYNSLMWGQVDGILTTFVLLSLYFAYKRKIFPSILFLLIALNFKMQAIIFIPVLGLILFPHIVRKFSGKNLTACLLALAALQTLILLPFALAGDLDTIWGVATHYTNRYPFVSMNAYNMWYWFVDGDLTTVLDDGFFLGMTLRRWGLLLFFIVSFFALLPLLSDVYLMVFLKRRVEFSLSKIFLVAALIPLIFFFFNTQMHERYSHPAIILLAIYSVLTKRLVPYFLITTAYLLNMEAVLQYLQLHNYKTVIFAPQFVAGIYLILISVLFFDLYKKKYNNQIKDLQATGP